MSDFQPGDRVRVTFETTVADSGCICTDPQEGMDGDYLDSLLQEIPGATVEVIEPPEPPVETFGPGDVLRYKGNETILYALGETGFLSLSNGKFVEYGGGFRRADQFTSREFERVNVE